MVQVERQAMTTEITYSQARAKLASLLDDVTENREVIIIRRRKGEDAALIAASELTSLLETAYLLRSPANAERLLTALNDALQGTGRPMSLAELRAEVELDGEAA
jgi:antitoxin YefM